MQSKGQVTHLFTNPNLSALSTSFSEIVAIKQLKMKYFKARNTFLIALCFLGCAYQVYDIVSIYLSFEMVAEVSVTMLDEFHEPSLAVCMRYPDVFDYHSFRKYTNFTLNTNLDPKVRYRELFEKVTIKQIFDHTPHPDHFFNRCVVRAPDNYNIKRYDANECKKIFVITKFYLQEYICYKLDLSIYHNQSYLIEKVAYSLTHQALLPSFLMKVSQNRSRYSN